MSNVMRTVLLKVTLILIYYPYAKIVVVCFRFDWIQEVDHLRLLKSLDRY